MRPGATRFALAPGYHLPRLRRSHYHLPPRLRALTTICRACGALITICRRACGALTTISELATGDWINSEPLKLKDLRGRVVLIDFWTFGCYNCRNTLPFVNSWNDRYRDKGLTIIGVHPPEFDDERKIENLRRQVASLGIRYPVVRDNDYQTWKAYQVEAWPTIFLLDKQGRIRWMHVGEGNYDEAERLSQKLIDEKET